MFTPPPERVCSEEMYIESDISNLTLKINVINIKYIYYESFVDLLSIAFHSDLHLFFFQKHAIKDANYKT